MRALLLAAGFGTRLRPLTDVVPKCLVPLNGVPILEIWLQNLMANGVDQVLINTHYLRSKVEAFVSTNKYAKCVTLVHESALLGTAGTLVANLDFFGDQDGMLIHADNYCLPEISEFIDAHLHRPKECLMTMMTFNTDEPSSCGIVELSDNGVVQAFYEKVNSPPGNIANGAVYILSKELLALIADEINGVSDFSREVLPLLIGRIFTFQTKSIFIDIGTHENYIKANNHAQLSSCNLFN
jgi:mannose-1-phosphate guanylyltransferase